MWSTRLFAAAALIAASSASAAVVCPARQGALRLTNVSLFDGPPSEHADLVPDEAHKDGPTDVSSWDIAYIFQADRQPYATCQYGKSRLITRSVAKTASKCLYLSTGRTNRLVCK